MSRRKRGTPAAAEHCRLCGAEAPFVFEAELLGRHQVAYYHCPTCGYLQTEQPWWLDEAYRSPINISDTGILQRNLDLARRTSPLLYFRFARRGTFLDYAGGYGLYVRLMRDQGFDFRWQDAYADNLFARGFEAEPGGTGYALVTAFECLEHLVHPLQELERILQLGPGLLFSTLLLPDPPPAPEQWWYYGLEHGQHVGFFSRRSLQWLAGRLGKRLASNGSDLHLFSDTVGNTGFRLLLHSARLGSAWLVRRLLGSRSFSDMELLAGGRADPGSSSE